MFSSKRVIFNIKTKYNSALISFKYSLFKKCIEFVSDANKGITLAYVVKGYVPLSFRFDLRLMFQSVLTAL